ncbi:unnamed protein product [Sphagnum troendelagicum]|uniref:Zinc finger PHD-type domain-containing protein n=1 Tax=Sphagnum troendelagicum TaxID=128251 RepID=A0ABP0THG9_9BRYO
MARTMATLVMEGEVPSATLHLSFETKGSNWTFPLRKEGFFRGYNCMKDLKLAGVLQTNVVAVDVEQLEPAANEDESQSSTENAAKQPVSLVAVATPEEEALMASESLRTLESPEDSKENAARQPVAVATAEEKALMASESLRTLESPEDSEENAPKQPVAVSTPEEALMASESLRTLESPEDSTENAARQPVAVATAEEKALMASESLRTLESPEDSTENAPTQPVAVATREEGALMAPESLRTLESPETSNVLAAEGSPERRKRKKLAGRAVGRIPPRSALKLLQREEEEMKICSLDEYEIFDDDEEAASLLDLPLHYRKHTLGGSTTARELYVRGKADNLVMVMRRISAWHLKCFRGRPLSLQLSFLGSDSWVKLLRPSSGYRKTAAAVLIVANFLAYVKIEPHASESAVWRHLQGIKTFLGMEKSSEQQEADDDEHLLSNKRPRLLTSNKEEASTEQMSEDAEDCSVEEKEDEEEESEDEIDQDDEELGDPLCTICDDGGDLLCCDGPCMRSFHTSKDAGTDSQCESLNLAQASHLEKWLCRNCKEKQHQCYICGELGASDEALKNKRQVFVCDVALCGRFYHPTCIAKELVPENSKAFAENIREGRDTFSCPLHKCKLCGKAENKEDKDLQLAKCRRCPSAWHRKCLPDYISFDDKGKEGQQRAWLVGKRQRVVIYCRKHPIIRHLSTPRRDHYKFPESQIQLPNRTQPLNSVQRCAGISNLLQKKSSQKEDVVETPEVFSSTDWEDRAKKRVHDIISKSQEIVTLESVKKKLYLPSNYKEPLNREFIHQGKLASIMSAVGKALERVKKGASLEDANVICSRDDLARLFKAETVLGVYLAPALHGMRYTTFGRHFTKISKLTKVVDRIHPFIADGDMIVDFSCGSNDFSILMHKALTSTGKCNCKYRNYDIFTPKNTFNFEKRDWFSVSRNELPTDETLVIGLNPPFGVNASLSDQFISHALIFRPRLVVLITPPQTKTLKHRGYTLIWEDDKLCRDRAFYLAGSVDKLECPVDQWNEVTPRFYLWCLNKWAYKYKQLAAVCGHHMVLSQDAHAGKQYVIPPRDARLGRQAQYLPITVNPESRPFRWQPPRSRPSTSSLAHPAPPFHQPTRGEGETGGWLDS